MVGKQQICIHFGSIVGSFIFTQTVYRLTLNKHTCPWSFIFAFHLTCYEHVYYLFRKGAVHILCHALRGQGGGGVWSSVTICDDGGEGGLSII